MAKRAVIVFLGLLLASPQASADRTETDAAAITVAAGAISGFICGTIAIRDRDNDLASDGYDRPGFFMGLGGSYGIGDFNDSQLTGDDHTGGVNARLGYRCHSRFSVEAEVEWLDAFDREYTFKIPDVSFEPIYTSVNTKVYLLKDKYQPFLMVGVGAIHLTTETDGRGSDEQTFAAFRLGGGIDVYATENFVLSLEASRMMPVSGYTDFQYTTIGLGVQYRF